MIKNLVSVIALTLLFSLGGCNSLKNPYSQFYRASPFNVSDSEKGSEIEPEISFVEIDGFRSRVNDFLENNFLVLGESHFYAQEKLTRDKKAIAQAKEIGATHILVGRKFKNSRSGSVPLTLPTQNTSYTHGNVGGQNFYGNINGNNFSGNTSGYSYSGTSTTYGSKTTNIPFHIETYTVACAFFVPKKTKPIWGVYFDDLTAEERKLIGTNKALKITAVMRGGAFFNADIFRGDVILKINDKPVYSHETLKDIIKKSKVLNLELFRKGKIIKKTVSK